MTHSRHSLLAAALFLLVPAHLAVAQDSTRTWSLGADNQSGVYVGIAVSPAFRLEPELSIVREHQKATFTIDNGFGSVEVINDELTAASYRVGVTGGW